MESGLSASSDKEDCASVAGAGTSADLKASSDHKTPKEPNAPSSCVADPEGVPVSVRSLSDWEAVTTPDATFLGLALVVRAARAGVVVSGGTYSGSCSSSEPITNRADGATDLERPRALTRSYFGAFRNSTCKESLLVLEGVNKTSKNDTK